LEPDGLAFDNAGDLYISSFALKRVYELTPTGRLTDLGVSYADQFALDPAGEMLVGTHGGLIQELTAGGAKPFYDVVPRAAGIDWGGDHGFQKDGIAVTKRGTVYVDNSQGNGYGEGTVLVRITANKHASLAPIRTPLAATLPRVGAAGFPVSTYPASRPSRGATLASCRSDVGIEPFDGAAIARARRIAQTYLASQFASDIAVTDRSWWMEAFDKVAGGDIAGRNVVSGERPVSNSSLANGLAQACGQRLVDDSISITVGGYSNFAGTLYLLDRGGNR
jgi:hypothetical protein